MASLHSVQLFITDPQCWHFPAPLRKNGGAQVMQAVLTTHEMHPLLEASQLVQMPAERK